MSRGGRSLVDVEIRADWQILAPFFQEQMAWLSRILAPRNLRTQGGQQLDTLALGLGFNAALIMLHRIYCTMRVRHSPPFLSARRLLTAPPEVVLNDRFQPSDESRAQLISDSSHSLLSPHEIDLTPPSPPPSAPLSQPISQATETPSPAAQIALPDPPVASHGSFSVDRIDILALRAGTEAILDELAQSNRINAELRMIIQDLEGQLQRVQDRSEQRSNELEQRLQLERQARLEAEAALQAALTTNSQWQQERDTLQAALNAMELEHENVLVALYELEMEKRSQQDQLRDLHATLRQVRLEKVQEVATLRSKIEEPPPMPGTSARKLPFPAQQGPTLAVRTGASPSSSSSQRRRTVTPQRAGWKSKSLFSSPTSVTRQYSPAESFTF